MKRRESAWTTLDQVSDFYHATYRLLRNRYKWSPDVVDAMDINRILRVSEETQVDYKKEGDEPSDFEE
jgi:hypothetical protein